MELHLKVITNLANVSYLAKEFNVTKPTISDAVRVLLKKGYVEKDYSPTDNRRYNLQLSTSGKELIKELLDYHLPISNEIQGINEAELKVCFDTISKLIYQLNQKGIIQVQRICCQEIRLDCLEFEEK